MPQPDVYGCVQHLDVKIQATVHYCKESYISIFLKIVSRLSTEVFCMLRGGNTMSDWRSEGHGDEHGSQKVQTVFPRVVYGSKNCTDIPTLSALSQIIVRNNVADRGRL